MNPLWKHPLPAAMIIKAIAPGLPVPKGGWHAAAFSRHGVKLLRALVRASRITGKTAKPVIERKANEIFSRQLERVIQKVQTRRGTKADPIQISLGNDESLWAQAIQEVFDDAGVEIVIELVPPIQSVMGQAYSRVSALMGVEPTIVGTQRIARQAQGIASRITGINQTTRDVFARQIRGAIEEGLSVTETAARLRDVMPDFNQARVATIARTETQNAWTKGTIASFQEAETLTHVSVIGCESREKDRWNSPSYQQFMYRGESTCNISLVPVVDMDKLNFHPNHTGTMVPAAFRNEDGSVTNIE